MKARSDIVATARLPPHGPLCHGSSMVFSSLLRTSMSTMLGLRRQEPLSCLNPRMGRQRDDIELRILKDIDGCSWRETSIRGELSVFPASSLLPSVFYLLLPALTVAVRDN